MEVISRSAARDLGFKRYFTGKACKHGHVATRQTGDARCSACARVLTARYRAENAEKVRERDKLAKRQKGAETTAYMARYRREKRELVRAAERRWRLANKSRRNANNAKYYTAKKMRLPAGLTLAQ